MNAWIFDVDGVLSNLETRQIRESSLLPALAKILNQGDILAFNTGRTTVWVEERILTLLKPLLKTPSLLEHVFLSCEKGGVWKQEAHEQVVQEKFVAPLALRYEIRKLVQQEFQDAIIFDEPKQTMISLEMREDVTRDYFQGRLAELERVIPKYLQRHDLMDMFVTSKDLIAIDIQHKSAGKDVGMEHILTWLETYGHKIGHFYCFGDNPSDAHMGELLVKHKLSFTFVYVGIKPLSQLSFIPIIPEKKFDKGTAEILQQLLT